MEKLLRTNVVAILMYVAFFSVFVGGCSSRAGKESVSQSTNQSSSSTPINSTYYVSREVLGNRLLQQEKQLEESPNNPENLLAYAQTLFSLGNFSYAEKVVEPLTQGKKPLPEALELSARLYSLQGEYREAEKRYQKLLTQKENELTARAREGLRNVYYQTNQYQKVKRLESTKNDKSPLRELMESFGEEQPYQIDWKNHSKATIPFTAKDPAPVIPIEVNGVKMNAVLDTSADGLVLDQEKAAEMGIAPIAKFRGKCEGGGSGDVAYGKAQSLKLGEIEVTNIPTTISRWTSASEELFTEVSEVHAVIGINVLKQFIPTINYETGELTLLPRGEMGQAMLSERLSKDKIIDQVPFTLSGTHYLHAKGSVNQRNHLNMLINSGMVTKGGNGPILSGALMKLLNTPVPKLEQSELTGIDGEKFQVGSLSVSSYGIGRLVSEASIGQYYSGEVLESLSQSNGFVTDAMVGHQFLKNQTWTIDFDRMSLIFSKASE